MYPILFYLIFLTLLITHKKLILDFHICRDCAVCFVHTNQLLAYSAPSKLPTVRK